MSDYRHPPVSFHLLGIRVHALGFAEAVERIRVQAGKHQGGYVCFANVYSITLAEDQKELKAALNGAWLTTTDGQPVVKMARRKAVGSKVERVYGPDVLHEVCKKTAGSSLTHYFYGGKPGVAEKMAEALVMRYPGLQVAGVESPSFAPLSEEEKADFIRRMEKLSPRFIWVGLGTPKQEILMAELTSRLPNSLFLGVGAAFDFVSGEVNQAPKWIRDRGWEWCYRLLMEPKRLWRRYFIYNTRFLWKTRWLRKY